MKSNLDIIYSRRSTRVFKADVQIKNDELNAILKAGLLAPTGCNYQSCFFTVIQNKK